mgnify:FL=1
MCRQFFHDPDEGLLFLGRKVFQGSGQFLDKLGFGVVKDAPALIGEADDAHPGIGYVRKAGNEAGFLQAVEHLRHGAGPHAELFRQMAGGTLLLLPQSPQNPPLDLGHLRRQLPVGGIEFRVPQFAMNFMY